MLKFEHTQTQDDGGGFVTITAQSPEDVGVVLSHYNFSRKQPSVQTLMEEATAIQAGYLVKVLKSEKRPWYVCSGLVDEAFMKPYLNAYQKVTGQPFTEAMDLTPHNPKRLCFTHLCDSMFFNGKTVEYRVFDESEDWDGRKAADRVPSNVNRVMKDVFGVYVHTPEFIKCGNGMFRHNPEYGRASKPNIPGIRAVWFYEAMINWWRTNKANDAQRAVMDECDKIHKKIGTPDYMVREGQGVVGYSGIRTSWEQNKVMTWEEFQKL